MQKKDFINVKAVRVDEQRAIMEQIVKDGVCPFCMENFTRYHKKPILRDGERWVLTPSQWPYENTKYHFLAVSKKHIERLEELQAEDITELLDHFKWANKEYGMPGGTFFMRFGNMKYNGSSVAHLHAQLLQGDCDAPNHQHVRVKLG